MSQRQTGLGTHPITAPSEGPTWLEKQLATEGEARPPGQTLPCQKKSTLLSLVRNWNTLGGAVCPHLPSAGPLPAPPQLQEEEVGSPSPQTGLCGGQRPPCEYALKSIELPSVCRLGLWEEAGTAPGVRRALASGLCRAGSSTGRGEVTATLCKTRMSGSSRRPPVHLPPDRTFHKPGSSVKPKSGLFAQILRVCVITVLGADGARLSRVNMQ